MDVHIGTAGWAYKDWAGIVYPERGQRKPHPLEYLAGYFDLVEINTSFYGNLRPQVVREWCRRAAAVNARFLFTAKLYKSFTHSPRGALESTSAETIRCTPQDEQEAKQGYDALAGEGKLGALLAQFPVSFKNTGPNREYLETLLGKFRQYPLAVEVRHDSWNDPGTLGYFSAQNVAFCNIDQPRLGRSLGPTEHVTSRVGYIRLHGRNYNQWFEHQEAKDRYNYLYSERELEPWKDRIEQIAGQTEITFVVANNHFQGKAAVNALQMKSMIGDSKVKVPETLLRHYPQLADIAEGDAGRLFG